MRTSLSTFRSIGAALGLVDRSGYTIFLYTTDEAGNQVVRGGAAFTVIAGVFSLLAIICYVICYRLTIERVTIEKKPDAEKLTLAGRFRAIGTSLALLGIIGAAIFLLLSQLLINTMNNYIYPDYFGNARGISIFALAAHTCDPVHRCADQRARSPRNSERKRHRLRECFSPASCLPCCMCWSCKICGCFCCCLGKDISGLDFLTRLFGQTSRGRDPRSGGKGRTARGRDSVCSLFLCAKGLGRRSPAGWRLGVGIYRL